MLDRQVTSGGCIEGEGHVPRGEDMRGAAAHVPVDADPFVFDGQSRLGGQAGLGLHAPGDQEQVAFCAGLALQADPAVLERFDLDAQPQRYAIVLEPSPQNLAGGVAQPGRLGSVFHAHQRDGQSPPGQGRGRLAADEAGADHHRRAGRGRGLAQLPGLAPGPQVADIGAVGPRDRQRLR